ncbi:MAG: hypothetical protein IJ387_01535 [Thermoguttaceae bacterium]|nr:hypothetical protein [Thermoguttaceae bacterium]
MENSDAFLRLLRKDRRFTLETYRFVNEALEYAQELGMGKEAATENSNGAPSPDDVANHVTGQDLSRAAKDWAVLQYGLMAKTVLAKLGLRKTRDFGDAVYNMIEVGLMSKTPEDSVEDFDDVFDLGAELDRAFSFQYENKRRGRK